jgi:hypothetical protein
MESFARKVYSVRSDDMWYPSVDELLAAGVISNKPQTIARTVSPSILRQP